MATWPNAPLVYTLGIVRFPPVPNMERFVDGFHDAVRDRYPLKSHITSQNMTATFGPDGLKVEQIEEPLWQFAAANSSHAYILGGQFLVLHAGPGYGGHEDFAARLQSGLSRLIDVPAINIRFAVAVGFRYVDLVVPRRDRGEPLSDYLKDWALPATLPSLAGTRLELNEAVHVAAFQTDLGVLRFQALRRPPTTVPPELATPFVTGNGWVPDRPDGDFAVLDIDHGFQFRGEEPLDPGLMAAHIIKLRDVPYRLLLEAATPFALEVWKGRA